MPPDHDDDVFAVMATPDPVPAVVDRARWPVHVTIAANFRIGAPAVAGLPGLLGSIAHNLTAFGVELGPLEQFGAGKNVPVLLASHPLLDQIHQSLNDELANLSGFLPVDPDYWGGGYRPHATLGPAVTARAGDVLSIRTLTLVSLLGDSGHRLFAFDLR
jgi:2'-5' RNA ligase